ncbi:MAG: hypothetical protein ACP5NS_01690 [Candidatus Pacearchaeota archaeon]
MSKSHSTPRNTDLVIYIFLVFLLLLYAFYIKGTCEELGCLAVVIPIIGIMGLSVIECIVNIVYLFQRRKFNVARSIVFVITLLASILVFFGLITG